MPTCRLAASLDRLTPAPPFTPAAYLRHHARLRGLDGDGGAAGLAERLAFESMLGDRLAELSKGSLQKVVLAQALLGAPALIVLDEPFSGLDGDARRALRALLAERAAAGAAIVFTTHAEAAGDRVWQLRDGRVEER